MKKFHLFAGFDGVSGCFADLKGSFGSRQEALERVKQAAHPYDWFHVFESLEDGSLVLSKDEEED